MRRLTLMSGAAGLVFATAVAGQAVTIAEGEAFFARYVALGNAYDAALADLYQEDARIASLRRYPTGQERKLELSGTQWKKLIAAAMPLAKARGDRSEYRNVQIEPAGGLLRVRAERYSVAKCYWDKGYYMLIGRQSDGQLRIVEEYSETQPQSAC